MSDSVSYHTEEREGGAHTEKPALAAPLMRLPQTSKTPRQFHIHQQAAPQSILPSRETMRLRVLPHPLVRGQDASNDTLIFPCCSRVRDRMATSDARRRLRCADYHVAWICPIADVDLLPACLMLDEEHLTPEYDTRYDDNTYIYGTINGHAVVVASCPQGETGNVNAGRLTGSLFKTFPNIRMTVLVGIGGGIPRSAASESSLKNVHLGDVVVGWPGDGKPPCVYHDRGKSKVDGEFEMVGTMQNPDWRLISALSVLALDHKLRRTKFHDQLERLREHDEFAHPGIEHDQLFKADYRHTGPERSDCTECDSKQLVQRPLRTKEDQRKFVFHQGRIATGNAVIRDGELRDRIGARCSGALCVEMEAAGVDVNRRCLIIRGISDYADSHKTGVWRSYAAGKAAAFARELLCRLPPGTVKDMEGVNTGSSEGQ